jgi:hypothetical protein
MSVRFGCVRQDDGRGGQDARAPRGGICGCAVGVDASRDACDTGVAAREGEAGFLNAGSLQRRDAFAGGRDAHPTWEFFGRGVARGTRLRRDRG